MKFIVCVVAVFAALQCVSCLSDYNRQLLDQENVRYLKSSLREEASLEQVRSKLEDICPGYGDRLENVTLEVVTLSESIDETQETMCSIVRNHAKRCLAPITNLLEECLPTQAKQLPSMIMDMVISTTNHLCKTDGEHIFELGNTCIKNVNPKTKLCIRRITTAFQQYQRKESVPSARDLCDLLESLRPCFQSHLNSACGHPITRESYLSLFDEGMKACKKYEKKNEIDVVDIDAN